MQYAHVILPLPLNTTFTYSVPPQWQGVLKPGMRVIVQIGSHRLYTGLVKELTDRFEADYPVKDITDVPDTRPIVRYPQMKFWDWLASYYMSSPGDVYQAAVPAGLKMSSDTVVELRPDAPPPGETAFDSPQLEDFYMHLATGKGMGIRALVKAGYKNALQLAMRLADTGLATISEKLNERFVPKTVRSIAVALPRNDSAALEQAFAALKRSPRREQLFMHILQLTGFMRPDATPVAITADALKELPCYDSATLKSLENKGLITVDKQQVSRFKYDGGPTSPLPLLSGPQSQALREIHDTMASKAVTLLHGVTSSGKTEVYMHLIDHVLKQGLQTLFLVPEIALTTQLTRRLQKVFGDKVVIYHSRFSDAQRVEIWNGLLNTSRPLVILAARSGVFLPFAKLGLVIVDEEHESSYKQFDPAPRYNARDAAIVLATMHGAKVLLGSATPATETYSKARSGKYGLVSLSQRYAGTELPSITVTDTSRNATRGLAMHGNLAPGTVEAVNQALAQGRQAIIFHNRRGFAPVARCKSCEYIPRCTDCDVSLSYHRHINSLVCHYCGQITPLPKVCPVCHEPTIETVGYGTERVEDSVEHTFPGAKVLRMDLDTTRNKDNYSSIIERFSQHKADILVGTQMVTKGLDFGEVSTVVIPDADMVINYPDFRSAERAFNMLEQVAGRAGRRDIPGNVIIQTRNPGHPVLRYLLNHDYPGFYEHELEERRQYNYPPFTRVIYVMVKCKDEELCQSGATLLADTLKQQLGSRILGPHTPGISRIKTYYYRRIIVKIENTASIQQVKHLLRDDAKWLRSQPGMSPLDIYFDVDPL